MLGVGNLKDTIELTEEEVECPVKDCRKKVKRKYKEDTHKLTDEFRCPRHKIVISPSTFVYPNELDNLLWKDQSDLDLLERIRPRKRGKSRKTHDNSEDAVSWNVFRFLEKNDLIEGLLDSTTGTSPRSTEVIYWSYSQREDSVWSRLDEARREFEGEKVSWSSEPDIIVSSDNALFFIEAKFDASNRTTPSNKSEMKFYMTGGDNWFSKVFLSDYETIAIDRKRYELLRFWLLGTWIAEQYDLDFYLINLVRSEKELDIEAKFKPHIKETPRRKFLRVTWESIYQYISERKSMSDKDTMLSYFRNKTVGYKKKKSKGIERGFLEKAFSIPS